MQESNDEILQALSQSRDDIPFEELPGEETSPLNQPVVEKNVGGNTYDSHAGRDSLNQGSKAEHTSKKESFESFQNKRQEQPFEDDNLDAPEQHIDEEYQDTGNPEDDEKFEVPHGHAKQAADTILGVANNIIEIGGGYFIKIRKHKDLFEIEEFIKRIDNQNDRNLKRIKLDNEDKALLRPLIITMLKTKAQQLTPEQQLMGAIIAILIKKTQFVMEVRKENDHLVNQLRETLQENRTKKATSAKQEPTDYEQQPDDNIEDFTTESGIEPAQVIEVSIDDENQNR